MRGGGVYNGKAPCGEDDICPADHLVVVLESLDGPGLQAAGLEGPQHLPLQGLVDVVVVADHRVIASSLQQRIVIENATVFLIKTLICTLSNQLLIS